MLLYRTVFLLVSVAALQTVSGYATGLTGGDLGIIDGHFVTIEDAPYMAALLKKINNDTNIDIFGYYCSSTIIHEQFLLTSARCAVDVLAQASVGHQKCITNDQLTYFDIEKFIPHKDFKNNTGENDICLAKLKKPLKFNKKIAKATLADKDTIVDIGIPLNVTGWGSTKATAKEGALYLHQATVPAVLDDFCPETVADKTICAGTKGRGVCYLDDGGPLTLHDVQVGIVSRSNSDPHCGKTYDVYTRISVYRDWIDENIKKNL